jgi:hypothetical protein
MGSTSKEVAKKKRKRIELHTAAMAAKEHMVDSTRTSLLAVNGNITLSE